MARPQRQPCAEVLAASGPWTEGPPRGFHLQADVSHGLCLLALFGGARLLLLPSLEDARVWIGGVQAGLRLSLW